MDDRQKKVEVGAGLQDARLNQEFIGWLKKWGNRILTVLLIVVAAYAGKVYWDRYQLKKVDSAFAEWDSARQYESGQVMGSHTVLLAVAADHRGQASVPELAKLDAAQVYMRSAMMGAEAGADPANLSPDMVLTDEQIRERISNAESLYREVLAATASDPRKLLLAQAARQGVVSALLSRGGEEDFAAAETMLDEIIAKAEAAGGLQDQVVAARRLKEKLPKLRHPVPAVAAAALPPSATEMLEEPLDDFSQFLPPSNEAPTDTTTVPAEGDATDAPSGSGEEDAPASQEQGADGDQAGGGDDQG